MVTEASQSFDSEQAVTGKAKQLPRDRMMRQRRLSVFAIIAAFAVLTGCPQKVRISIKPGGTTRDLHFLIDHAADGAQLSIFAVRTCSSAYSGPRNEYWVIEASTSPTSLHELTYG